MISSASKLIIVKVIHTIVWVFFNLIIVYLFWAGINDSIDQWVWIGIGCVFVECIVLLVFSYRCPLTLIARRYSASTLDNFDIYLPNWLARYNKEVYGVLFLASVLIILFRQFY